MRIQTGSDTVAPGGSATTSGWAKRPALGHILIAQVTERTDDGYRVRSGNQLFRATQAFSCLIEAEPGDTVQCLRGDESKAWIVAVLERTEHSTPVLKCPADTSVESANGRLSFQTERLRMQSQAFQLDSGQTQLNTGETEVIGSSFRVIGRSFKMIGNAFHGVMDRVTQFSKNYLRTTHGLDRVQSQHIEMTAKQLVRVSGEHTLFEGEKLVKTRGNQIHFG